MRPSRDAGGPRAIVALEAVALTAGTLGLALGTGEPAVWFFVPLAWTLAWRRPLEGMGLRWSARPPGAGHQIAAGSALGVASLVGLVLLHDGLPPLRMPDDLWRRVLRETFGTAVPEETFFRGWLQERLAHLLGHRPIAVVVVQATAFAACHALVVGPVGWATLPFGLFAGWLRARSGSIVAPVAWHAAGNLVLASLGGIP